MHISHQSPDLLVVEHRPWAAAWVLTVVAVAGPWLLFKWLSVEGLVPTLLAVFIVDFPLLPLFAIYIRRLQIVLDRRTGQVRLHELSVAQDRTLTMPLGRLVRAERETNYRRIPWLPKHGAFHRAVLVAVENRRLRRFPVTSVFLVGPSARAAADAINGWLGRPLDRQAPAA